MKYLGVDPSSFTGLVLLDGDVPTPKLVNFKKKSGFERVQLIAKSVGSLLDEWKPDLIAIEGYAYGNSNSLVTLVEIGTVIRREFYIRGIPWYDVPPTVLKKWVTGKGNAKKPDMAMAALDKWGFALTQDDIVDAYCLARILEAVDKGLVNVSSMKGVVRNDPV